MPPTCLEMRARVLAIVSLAVIAALSLGLGIGLGVGLQTSTKNKYRECSPSRLQGRYQWAIQFVSVYGVLSGEATRYAEIGQVLLDGNGHGSSSWVYTGMQSLAPRNATVVYSVNADCYGTWQSTEPGATPQALLAAPDGSGFTRILVNAAGLSDEVTTATRVGPE